MIEELKSWPQQPTRVYISNGRHDLNENRRHQINEIPNMIWKDLGIATVTFHTYRGRLEHIRAKIEGVNGYHWDKLRAALDGLFGGHRKYGFIFHARTREESYASDGETADHLFFVKASTCEAYEERELDSCGYQYVKCRILTVNCITAAMPGEFTGTYTYIEPPAKTIKRLRKECLELGGKLGKLRKELRQAEQAATARAGCADAETA